MSGAGRLVRGSNPAENQQNDYDQEDQPHSSGRVVTPVPAMRPPWQDTQQCQNQDDDQYSSKHIVLLVMYSVRAQPHSRLSTPLPRDVDRNRDVRIPAVVQVVAVVDVGNINVVVVIPVISPVFRPWVNETDPIALILKARISLHNQEGQAVDTEP